MAMRTAIKMAVVGLLLVATVGLVACAIVSRRHWLRFVKVVLYDFEHVVRVLLQFHFGPIYRPKMLSPRAQDERATLGSECRGRFAQILKLPTAAFRRSIIFPILA